MPNKPIPHAQRRNSKARTGTSRLAALATATTLGLALTPGLIFAPAPAAAAPHCVPPAYTASSSADLIRLSALDAGVLALVPGPIADVTIGHTTADVAHPQPDQARGTARYLSATLAGITVPPALLNTEAQQDAPPPDGSPDEHSLVALDSGPLQLGAGLVEAAAGQVGPFRCARANANAALADAVVLPGTGGHSLLSMPSNLNSSAGATLINTGGHLSTAASAAVGLADMRLFGGTQAAIGVKVITEPMLAGVASGDAATSYVTYTSPVLDVTLPGGTSVHLDGAHTHLDVITPAVTGLLDSLGLPLAAVLPPLGPQLELQLTLGTVTKHVSATSVSGSAATLRLQVLLAPAGTADGIVAHAVKHATTVLDLGIGVLSVAASAPAAPGSSRSAPPAGGGPAPAPPSASASPSEPPAATPSTSASVVTAADSLPLTGSRTAWFVAAGIMILIGGRFLLVVSRRRTSG